MRGARVQGDRRKGPWQMVPGGYSLAEDGYGDHYGDIASSWVSKG